MNRIEWFFFSPVKMIIKAPKIFVQREIHKLRRLMAYEVMVLYFYSAFGNISLTSLEGYPLYSPEH